MKFYLSFATVNYYVQTLCNSELHLEASENVMEQLSL